MGPFLILAVVLLIFLNGATDASNSIASSVSSGALSMRHASVLAAVCSAAGGVAGMLFFGEIRQSVTENTDFGPWGEIGVLSAIGAAVIFTFIAWRLRLPTSESHAILAASAGASMVLGDGKAWLLLLGRPVFWMAVCAAAGFLAGAGVSRLFPRRLSPSAVRRMQILCAGGASFLHGVQDLAKFLALLGIVGDGAHPLILVLTAGVMGMGTLFGGRRMTEAVGEELASLDGRTALATDLGTVAALFCLSAAGIPASTTHARTCGAAGGAAVSDGCRLHGKQLLRFAAAWLATFPVCVALAAILAFFLRAII